MQIWDYPILTLKIPLKFVGLCGKYEVWLNHILTLNILTSSILITINLNN